MDTLIIHFYNIASFNPAVIFLDGQSSSLDIQFFKSPHLDTSADIAISFIQKAADILFLSQIQSQLSIVIVDDQSLVPHLHAAHHVVYLRPQSHSILDSIKLLHDSLLAQYISRTQHSTNSYLNLSDLKSLAFQHYRPIAIQHYPLQALLNDQFELPNNFPIQNKDDDAIVLSFHFSESPNLKSVRDTINTVFKQHNHSEQQLFFSVSSKANDINFHPFDFQHPEDKVYLVYHQNKAI